MTAQPPSDTERRNRLVARARVFAAVRRALDAAGFVEVHTPRLGRPVCMEPHLETFQTVWRRPRGRGDRALELVTSPEFACKRLLAQGFERIYDLGPVFRNEEETELHEPEFLMLEWYRAPGTTADIAADAVAVVRAACAAVRSDGVIAWRAPDGRDYRVATDGPWETLTFAHAFERGTGVCLTDAWVNGAWSGAALAAAARARGHVVTADDFASIVFSLWLTHVERGLGAERPTVVTRFPSCMAALARLTEDERFAERFELYIAGVEVANAFGELLDAPEQRARWAEFQAERAAEGRPPHAEPVDLLRALPRIAAPAAGIALGMDRLVMLALGAPTVADVTALPHGG